MEILEDGKLNHRQLTALEALTTAKNFTEAAEKSGVTTQTIRVWMNNDPVFRAAYRQIKREAFEELSQSLVRLVRRAIEAYEKVLDNPADKGAINLSRTASDIIGHVLKLHESLDPMERVEDLESFQFETFGGIVGHEQVRD